MAAPKKKGKLINLTARFSLREGVDDDLIAFFESIPKGISRVGALKTALRAGGMGQGAAVTDDDKSEDGDYEAMLEGMLL